MSFKNFLPLFLCFSPILLLAQENMASITTDIEQQVINSYVGFPPLPFEAPDTDGTKHALQAYKGRAVVLYFWSTEVETSWKQKTYLEKLQSEYKPEQLMILTMAKEDEKAVADFISNHSFPLSIIPNTDELGAMGFAGELGDPRVFLIDTYGIINELFIGKHFNGETNLYKLLKPHVEAVLK